MVRNSIFKKIEQRRCPAGRANFGRGQTELLAELHPTDQNLPGLSKAKGYRPRIFLSSHFYPVSIPTQDAEARMLRDTVTQEHPEYRPNSHSTHLKLLADLKTIQRQGRQRKNPQEFSSKEIA